MVAKQFPIYFPKDRVIEMIHRNDVINRLFVSGAIYDSKTKKYIDGARIPTLIEIKKYPKLKKYHSREMLDKVKMEISTVDNMGILMSPHTKRIFVFEPNDIHYYVKEKNCRFPNSFTYGKLKERMLKYKKRVEGGSERERDRKSYIRDKRSIDFIDNFDLKVLFGTYTAMLYRYTKQNQLTTCRRPSYTSIFNHIHPYYSRSEIVNMAKNLGLIHGDETEFSTDIYKLCPQIINNDIKKENIIEHQQYIIQNRGQYLVKAYTFFLYRVTNTYLRSMNREYENPIVEKYCRNLWKLIDGAPAFDQEYTLYRWMSDDKFMEHVKQCGIFTDKAFISTTRNPFYVFKYPNVLTKIRIPKERGSGLCCEALTVYPIEQEVLLQPELSLQLTSRNDKVTYYHTDKNHLSDDIKKYEYVVKSKDRNKIIRETKNPGEPPLLNIEAIARQFDKQNKKLEERVKEFMNYTDVNNQFRIKLGDIEKTFIMGEYQAGKNDDYHGLYYHETSKGAMIYNLEPNGAIDFIIEIHKKGLALNYWHYKAFDSGSINLESKEVLNFIAYLGLLFGINRTIIFPSYGMAADLNPNRKHENYNYNYRRDFYNYLKNGRMRFGDEKETIKSQFKFYKLNDMERLMPFAGMEKHDELYDVFINANAVLPEKDRIDNMAKFYLYVVENHPSQIKTLEKKIAKLYSKEDNPFKKDYYVFYNSTYLYNNNLINEIKPIKHTPIVRGVEPVITKAPRKMRMWGATNSKTQKN